MTGQRGEGLIIEDDYDAGFRYDRDRSGPSRASPPPPGVIGDPDGVSMGVDHIRQARTEEYVN